MYFVRKAFTIYVIANFLFFLDKTLSQPEGETNKINPARRIRFPALFYSGSALSFSCEVNAH